MQGINNMSRCMLDNEDTGDEVVIGWGPGLNTYLAQVVEPGDEEPGLWLGTQPGEYQEPDEVIKVINPYACSFDYAVLKRAEN